MKKILLLILLALVSFPQVNAQIDDNPIDKMAKALYGNDMLTYRYLRNFGFIKTNSFKQKALIDMDKSLAKFDDNLSYIVLHLPEDKDVKEDFLKLQNFWNRYRISITNYDQKNYEVLLNKTEQFRKLIKKLSEDLMPKMRTYDQNKKILGYLKKLTNNQKDIDKLGISYMFHKGLTLGNKENFYDINLSDSHKRLKKIAKKNKNVSVSILADLHANIKMIAGIFNRKGYHPKMFYANLNNYTRKNHKLFIELIGQLKN